MPIKWPPLAEGACQHFALIAVFGEIDPDNIVLTKQPAGEHKLLTSAKADDGDTFVLVRPTYFQDDPLSLVIHLSRKGWYAGDEPKDGDLATLPDLIRRVEPFLGKSCLVHITGEYFIPVGPEIPIPLKAAYGPFGSNGLRFTNTAGFMRVEDSPVQQVTWGLRDDGQWKLSLTGWFRGTMSPDTLSAAADDFHSAFRALKTAEVSHD